MHTFHAHRGPILWMFLLGAATWLLLSPAHARAIASNDGTGTGTHAATTPASGGTASTIDPTGNGAPGLDVHLVDQTPLSEADPSGTERTVELRLRARPTSPVTIAFNQYDVEVVGGAVTIEPGHWDDVVELHVRAEQDRRAETSPHPASLGFRLTSFDARFSGMIVAPLALSVLDDDVAGVQCVPGAGWNSSGVGGAVQLREDAAPATCALTLTSIPTAPVTLTGVTSDPDVTLSNPTVTFEAGATTAVNVQLRAVSDEVDQPEHRAVTVTWTVSTADPVYGAAAPPTIGVDLVDDDTAGINLSSTSIRTTEGAAAPVIVGVMLATKPTSAVRFELLADDGVARPQVRVAANSATLEVLPATWKQTRSISVTAIDDALAEGEHTGTVRLRILTSDPAYSALAAREIRVTITDNDLAGVVFTPTDGGTAVGENGAKDVVDVKLKSEPSAEVTVDLEVPSGITTDPRSLTFTAANWNVPQRATVLAVDDKDVESPQKLLITARTHSTDPAYLAGGTAAPSTHEVSVDSDDMPGVSIGVSGTSTSVAEGGASDDYTVTLMARPTGDVKVAVEVAGEVTVDQKLLTFTSSNWSTAQTVRVTAIDDQKVEPTPHRTSIRHAIKEPERAWQGVTILGIDVDIADNDQTRDTEVADPDPGGDTGTDDGGGSGEDGEEEGTRVERARPNVPAATIRPPASTSAAPVSSTSGPGFAVAPRDGARSGSTGTVVGSTGSDLAASPRGRVLSHETSTAERARSASIEQARAREAHRLANAPVAQRVRNWAADNPVIAVPAVTAGAAGSALLLSGLLGDPFSPGRGGSLLRFLRRRP